MKTTCTVLLLLVIAAFAKAFVPRPTFVGRTRVLVVPLKDSPYEEAITQLEREYQALQLKLRGDLQENRLFDAAYDAEALLEKEADITSFEIDEKEEELLDSYDELMHAHENVEQAQATKEEARLDAALALNEAVLLEEIDSDHEDLENFLLAQAEYGLKVSDDLLKEAETKEGEALGKEIQAEDLLRFLEEKETRLRNLLTVPKNKKSLQALAKHELPKHEALIKVVKQKLIDHDPTKGSVAF